MNITPDIITDLYPLYAEGECSADTRRLVETYLEDHPALAADLRRIHQTSLGGSAMRPPRDLGETQALQRARRELRRRAWLMGAAIFFTCGALSFRFEEGKLTWLFQAAPTSAVLFGVAAFSLWVLYLSQLLRSRTL